MHIKGESSGNYRLRKGNDASCSKEKREGRRGILNYITILGTQRKGKKGERGEGRGRCIA